MALPNDLPRKRNRRAVVGDDRNDENLVVAQTHLAFLKFHNRVMDRLPPGEEDDGAATFTQAEETRKNTSFHNARRAVRWHYQWLVLNDFLRRIVDPSILDDVRANGRRFFRFDRAPFNGEPFMPLEFSGAAYRFGHSMVRQTYDYNRVFTEATLDQLFTFTGAGVAPIPSNWIIDWRRFHEVGRADSRNFTRKMDPKLIPRLHELPNVRPNQPRSLAVRNLLRGSRIGLPKAQDVAEAMEMTPLTREQLGGGDVGPRRPSARPPQGYAAVVLRPKRSAGAGRWQAPRGDGQPDRRRDVLGPSPRRRELLCLQEAGLDARRGWVPRPRFRRLHDGRPTQDGGRDQPHMKLEAFQGQADGRLVTGAPPDGAGGGAVPYAKADAVFGGRCQASSSERG